MKKMSIALLFLLAMSSAGYGGQAGTVLKVKVQTANIRVKADSAAAVIKQVPQGTLLESRAKVGDWYEVSVTTDLGLEIVGYLSANVVDVFPATIDLPTVQGKDGANVVRKVNEKAEMLTDREKLEKASEDIGALATALRDYLTDKAIFPKQNGIYDQTSIFYKEICPVYLKIVPLKDPWGNNYRLYLGQDVNGPYGISTSYPDAPDEFIIVSLGPSGKVEKWTYDPKNPQAGLFSELDQTKNLINLNGKMIRDKMRANEKADSPEREPTTPSPPEKLRGAPKLIKLVKPKYPPRAQQARVEGIVILDVTTDKQGKVIDVRVLRSIPLLDEAAVEAVKQYIYEPWIIDGVPRGVSFTVTVRFTLK